MTIIISPELRATLQRHMAGENKLLPTHDHIFNEQPSPFGQTLSDENVGYRLEVCREFNRDFDDITTLRLAAGFAQNLRAVDFKSALPGAEKSAVVVRELIRDGSIARIAQHYPFTLLHVLEGLEGTDDSNGTIPKLERYKESYGGSGAHEENPWTQPLQIAKGMAASIKEILDFHLPRPDSTPKAPAKDANHG